VRAPGRDLRGAESQRKRLTSYLLSYTHEAWERGLPVVRPLALQYPDDVVGRNRTDEFMLGDELLIAPSLRGETALKVALPRGVWTDLGANEIYKGRQEIAVKFGGVAMFARNGAIVPMDVDGAMELHYFPSLGAEFFVFEEKEADFSQFHAAPAAGFLRLESEPRVSRIYEWIVHHSGPCRKVMASGVELAAAPEARQLAPGRWFYDKAADNLHVRVKVEAGTDHIVNVSY
jgi:hypothetical protein